MGTYRSGKRVISAFIFDWKKGDKLSMNENTNLFYDTNIAVIQTNLIDDVSEKKIIARPEPLIQEDSYDCMKVYYVSDIHLDQKIAKYVPKGATEKDVDAFIKKIVQNMVRIMIWKYPILIAGDVSSNFVFSKMFFNHLARRVNNSLIFVTLGNHELWGESLAKKTADEVVEAYRQFFSTIRNVIYLENELHICTMPQANNLKYFDGTYIEKGKTITEKEILTMSDKELQKFCLHSPFIVLGGIGYSGYNDNFNAENGVIYRSAVLTREEDIQRSKLFEKIYTKIKKILGDKKVIILTHTQKENWSLDEYNPNWIYVNGHTHQNQYNEDKVKTVYSDNQTGYLKYPVLKYFSISPKYDIFQYYSDGIYEISREQYLDFYRGLRVLMQFNKTDVFIIMLKKKDIYCFLMKNKKERLYILNGGKYKKLSDIEQRDISYYYANLEKYASILQKKLFRYQQILSEISKYVQLFGGTGIIHGCIVDIDKYNHIYLNPLDGKITPYYATSMTKKYVYDDIQKLLKNHCPLLINKYSRQLCKGNKLEISNNTKADFQLDEDTVIYQSSRIMRSYQYLTDVKVVRIWNDAILDE